MLVYNFLDFKDRNFTLLDLINASNPRIECLHQSIIRKYDFYNGTS